MADQTNEPPQKSGESSDVSPNDSVPEKPPGVKFGMQELEVCFVLLIALAQIGLPMIGVQQSFWLGLAVWVVFTVLLLHIVWRWEASARFGVSGRIASTLVVIVAIYACLYSPLKKEYKTEHAVETQPRAIDRRDSVSVEASKTEPRKNVTEAPSKTANNVPGRPNEEDPRIQFTASSLWTEHRKEAVRRQIDAFDQYLSRYTAIISVPKVLPLISIGKQLSYAVIRPLNPPYDQRHIPVAIGHMDPLTIRRMYSDFVFDVLLHDASGQAIDWSLTWEQLIYREYFTLSSLNTPPTGNPKLLDGWVFTLWEIRTKRGQDFLDRALLYGIKAPMANNEKNEKRRWALRLRDGILVVSDVLTLIEVNKILEQHGLLIK